MLIINCISRQKIAVYAVYSMLNSYQCMFTDSASSGVSVTVSRILLTAFSNRSFRLSALARWRGTVVIGLVTFPDYCTIFWTIRINLTKVKIVNVLIFQLKSRRGLEFTPVDSREAVVNVGSCLVGLSFLRVVIILATLIIGPWSEVGVFEDVIIPDGNLVIYRWEKWKRELFYITGNIIPVLLFTWEEGS